MITINRHITTLLYPKPFPLFHHHYPSPFSLPFCTSISSDSPSFPVSYLINTFGFSSISASKMCSSYNLRFKTAENPNSVLSFFRDHGFSDTQLRHMIEKVPTLLSCDPFKRVLPKFQFFQSKGASASDIVDLVSKKPYVLCPSVEKKLVPAYEFFYKFLQSDKDTLALLNSNPALFADSRVKPNIRMLIENGVTDSNIARMLQHRSRIFSEHEHHELLKVVEELKGLGFHPSKSTFATAMVARIVQKILWKKKVDAFKKWGWCDEDIIEAFRRHPHCMLASVDKINLVMSFWVNQLGYDPLALVKRPTVIGLSLEGRIIPRASVVQYLLEKGLLKNDASLTYPFTITYELFLDKYIKRFKEESSNLLNMYEEKLNCAYTLDKTGIS